MKNLKFILAILLTVTLVAVSLTGRADEKKPKPYPLDTCLICGKSEKADFDKNPGKYIKNSPMPKPN